LATISNYAFLQHGFLQLGPHFFAVLQQGFLQLGPHFLAFLQHCFLQLAPHFLADFWPENGQPVLLLLAQPTLAVDKANKNVKPTTAFSKLRTT